MIATLAALIAGCGLLPRMHRVTVQQGNVITQDMIDQLKPGMTRRQVAFIMGEPVVKNTFNPDRWDYVYSIVIPNVGTQTYRVSLYFDQDLLGYFTGDFAPSSATESADTAQEATETPDSVNG